MTSAPHPADLSRRVLRAGPGRRNAQLFAEPFTPTLAPGGALVRNRWTLIYPGVDLGTMTRAAEGEAWLDTGRLAIGRVERAAQGAPSELAPGAWVYWSGPHADWAELDPARHAWAPLAAPDPKTLPAGIGAEAEAGLREALGDAPPPRHAIVAGQGMLGHLAALWLKSRGTSVVVVENSPKRLEFSKYAGLRQKIDTHNVDWRERLARWAPEGADLLVDATGYAPPIRELLPFLNPGGALCLLGPWRDEAAAPPLEPALAETLREKGARLSGPAPAFGDRPGRDATLERWTAALAGGELDAERLITKTIVPADARMDMMRLAAGVRSIVGVVIDWGE